ncbi:papain-like cysteine protease family protein [uncultured Mameliella sp.]|uniref:papain-like cysteine protease family protein n=1 Tax=uncultured Mameliella sp. TaxID=1447087 RepID=UPI002619CFED|nr:papain-like cysteine protease family protein [uncultured Mameliella sp.]
MQDRSNHLSRTRRRMGFAVLVAAGLIASAAAGDQVSSGNSTDLDAYRSLDGSTAASGAYFNQIVGTGIAGSSDHVYVWYADGTVSSGTTKDLDAYRPRQSYNLPPGYHTTDIVGMGIAGSSDHVYAFYRNGMVSAGTSTDLDAYRAPYAYKLPAGKGPLSIVGMGIAGSDDHVWAWYADGTVSSGTTRDLEVYRKVQSFAPAAGKRADQIAGIGIAGSNDHIYAWYADCNPGSIGTVLNLRNIAQETGVWCWAASGEMVMSYIGNVDVPQCQQANNRFGRSDCCNSVVPNGCLSGGWAEYSRYGFKANSSGALSGADLKAEISVGGSCRGRPFTFTWAWPGGGGHTMVAMGYSVLNGKIVVHVQDPWPPNVGDYEVITYDYYVQSPGHHTHWTDYSDITYVGGN